MTQKYSHFSRILLRHVEVANQLVSKDYKKMLRHIAVAQH